VYRRPPRPASFSRLRQRRGPQDSLGLPCPRLADTRANQRYTALAGGAASIRHTPRRTVAYAMPRAAPDAEAQGFPCLRSCLRATASCTCSRGRVWPSCGLPALTAPLSLRSCGPLGFGRESLAPVLSVTGGRHTPGVTAEQRERIRRAIVAAARARVRREARAFRVARSDLDLLPESLRRRERRARQAERETGQAGAGAGVGQPFDRAAVPEVLESPSPCANKPPPRGSFAAARGVSARLKI
jgi:hypothetical protein